MLCINNYFQEYIDHCRLKVEQQLTAYRALVAAGGGQLGNDAGQFNTARVSFEPLFFNNLVLVLDGYFTDCSCTIEGKDGNPFNEVRLREADFRQLTSAFLEEMERKFL